MNSQAHTSNALPLIAGRKKFDFPYDGMLGFEHSVVNMFVIPVGMMFGSPISIRNWLLWNQLPVTLGNILAGVLFTGGALYATYRTKGTPILEMPVVETALEAEPTFAEVSGIAQ